MVPATSDNSSIARPNSTFLAELPVRRLSLLLIVGLVMLIGLVFPFPMSGRHWNAIFDLAHAPAFFLIFLLIVAVLDPAAMGFAGSLKPLFRLTRFRLVLLSGMLFLGGLACEIAQKFVQRHPSLGDIIANSIGLFAGTLFCLSRQFQKSLYRRIGTLLAMFLMVIPCVAPLQELVECLRQQREFPLLASFERPRELSAWNAHGAVFCITEEWASHGSRSLRIDSTGANDPGAMMVWPIPDWSPFASLRFALCNPDDHVVMVGITISDTDHVQSSWEPSDRFNWSMDLAPKEVRTVSVSLAAVASAPDSRRMDMTRISNVNIYLMNPHADATLYVDGMQLLK